MNFGNWTKLEEIRDEKGKLRFRCQCKCGGIYLLYPANVKKGSTQCKPCSFKSKTGEMIGRLFDQWTVLKEANSDGSNKYYLCRCTCGTEEVVNGSCLRRGMMKRCKQCRFKFYRTHGMKGTSTWVIWMGIKARCLNPKNRAFKNYGGRGITVCDKWLKFEGFFEDMGVRPEGLQIDRIDNDKGYYKENCAWVTPTQSIRNRRNTLKR